MKTSLYAIVSGDTRDEAIENAHGAFLELCRTKSQSYGGTIPIFDRYRLFEDLPGAEDGVFHTSDQETEELMDDVWESMIETLRSFEADDDDIRGAAGTAAKHRRYLIYDEQARAVLTPAHYNNLIERNDHWVVAARVSW